MDLLPRGPRQKKPALHPCDKNLILGGKKMKCSNSALLPQHVEMQCEKGIKPPTHKRKRGKMTATALAKAPPPSLFTHNLGNTRTELSEIL